MLIRGPRVFGTLWSTPSGPMYRPDGRTSPACQTCPSLRGVFLAPYCPGRGRERVSGRASRLTRRWSLRLGVDSVAVCVERRRDQGEQGGDGQEGSELVHRNVSF